MDTLSLYLRMLDLRSCEIVTPHPQTVRLINDSPEIFRKASPNGDKHFILVLGTKYVLEHQLPCLQE